MRAFNTDAIALASPSGRMSKRALKAAQERIRKQLFDGWTREDFVGRVEQPTDRERNLRQAKQLRELAARGMNPRAYLKEAERLEALTG
jgi:hypothetical protein